MTDDSKDCAHCAINRAIDAFSEKHGPMDIEVLIDDLSACMCELIASHPDPKARKAIAKDVAALIPKRARLFREEGRYPGGLGSGADVLH